MKTATLNIVRKKLSAVKPNPKNPRLHSPDQLRRLEKSLEDFGYAKGSMVVNRDGYLLSGHGMYEAMREEGYTQADFILVDLPPGEAEAFMIADNRLGDLSTWDLPLLNAEIAELQDLDVEIESTGFELDELEDFRGDNSVTEDDFDVGAALEEEPITQPGDLWLLGSHRVLCGDSTKEEDVERLMDGGKADMVFTDPPYGMGKDFENDNLSDMRRFHEKWMAVCPIASGYLIWYDPKNISDIIVPGEGQWGHMLDYLHLYKPNDIAFPRQSWIRKSESMIVFGSPEYIEIKPYAHDTYVWNHAGKDMNFYHPSVKPMVVVGDLLSRLGGQVICDPFLGSGTTLIACQQLGRRCVAMEICPAYVDVCVKRYINHVGTSEDVYVERDGKKLHWSEVSDEGTI